MALYEDGVAGVGQGRDDRTTTYPYPDNLPAQRMRRLVAVRWDPSLLVFVEFGMFSIDGGRI